MFSTLSYTEIIIESREKEFNPFPHNKILDHTKLKAFADDKLNVTKMLISVLDWVENIVGKGEIAWPELFNFQIYFNCHWLELLQVHHYISIQP